MPPRNETITYDFDRELFRIDEQLPGPGVSYAKFLTYDELGDYLGCKPSPSPAEIEDILTSDEPEGEPQELAFTTIGTVTIEDGKPVTRRKAKPAATEVPEGA